MSTGKDHTEECHRGIKYPAFQLYPRDLIFDTQAMSAAAFGMYVRLLSFAWIGVEGAPQGWLVDDDEILRKLAGASSRHWETCRDEVLKRFQMSADGLIANKRQLETLADLEALSLSKSAAARVRWDRAAEASTPAPAMHTHSKRNHKRNEPKAPPVVVQPPIEDERDESADFEAFFAAHPCQENRVAAQRAWFETGPSAPPDFRRPPLPELLEALAAQVEAKRLDPTWKRFFARPAKWLKDARWRDKPVAAVAAAPAKGYNPNAAFVAADPAGATGRSREEELSECLRVGAVSPELRKFAGAVWTCALLEKGKRASRLRPWLDRFGADECRRIEASDLEWIAEQWGVEVPKKARAV